MAMSSRTAEVINIRIESLVEGEAVQDGGRVHYEMSNRASPTVGQGSWYADH
ncbi:hypothetical protein BN77_p10942 [Rhizobium mesoamericanum STM3625]|uniref:Uncharacterized protein n=1 Tax=Rhizobium mesoamericanum STM3625 TaxID=1211777 RepID=K0Q1U7_9HYPH|nr:hypothetical protein BN77_p10942 [Rhizobium mesoamericanum STM3625]